MKDKPMSKPLSDEEKMLATGYVLGDLTDEETDQLEQLVSGNPDLLQEIHALQASLTLLPRGLPLVEPPPSLRKTIVETFSAKPIAKPSR
jgi:anti-sigma-K factor RskA